MYCVSFTNDNWNVQLYPAIWFRERYVLNKNRLETLFPLIFVIRFGQLLFQNYCFPVKFDYITFSHYLPSLSICLLLSIYFWSDAMNPILFVLSIDIINSVRIDILTAPSGFHKVCPCRPSKKEIGTLGPEVHQSLTRFFTSSSCTTARVNIPDKAFWLVRHSQVLICLQSLRLYRTVQFRAWEWLTNRKASSGI